MTGPVRNVSRTYEFFNVEDMIRKMPGRLRLELGIILQAFEPRLLARMRAGVPNRKGPRPAGYGRSGGRRPAGGLVSLLAVKFDYEKSQLRAGLLTPQARALGFYGYILDAGRGLKRQRSRRGSRVLAVVTSKRKQSLPYTRAISPIAPGRFDITFGRVRQWARGEVGPYLARAYDLTIQKLGWNG